MSEEQQTDEKRAHRYAAGEHILLTDGTYSNYGVMGFLRVKKDLDLVLCYNGWCDAIKELTFAEKPSFVAWLLAQGMVDDVDHRETNMGDLYDLRRHRNIF